MSGIAGILRFDGVPADPALLGTMTDAVRHRGPDAGGIWSDGMAGLGQRMLRTTPDAARDAGPVRVAAGDLCLAFDGRIDNRKDLLRELRDCGFAPAAQGDAGIVLAAWLRWREEMPRRLLGDFAFALWDGTRRSLFCARDILGVRPLCYAHNSERLLLGSELHQLLLDPTLPKALDEGMVGEFLAFSVTSPEDTVQAAVKRLPAAHWMRAEADGRVQLHRYWDVGNGPRVCHAQPEDYAHHLRDLLSQSVQCRLPAVGPVGVDLSGGVDSSTVCLLADRIGDPARLHAYTVAYPGLSCDETPFSNAVGGRLRMPRSVIDHAEADLSVFDDLAARYRDIPGYPVADGFFGSLAPDAMRSGCRVLLSGNGGDEWFAGEPDHLADLLLRGSAAALLREAARIAEWQQDSRSAVLWRHAIKPWLRRGLRGSFLRRLRPPSLEWLQPGWVHRIGLRERLDRASAVPAGLSMSQTTKRGWTLNAHVAHELEMTDRLSAGKGVEYRHPLFDQRLLEFAFAVPPELHFADGNGKCLLRRSVSDLLPAALNGRRGKADFSELTCRAVDRALALRPMRDWPAARAGWIVPAVLDTDYRVAREAQQRRESFNGSVIWRAWMAYACGLLL